jgi:hypothetical protein
LLVIVFAFLSISAPNIHASFESLGIPVRTTMVTATIVAPDDQGNDAIYFDCAQPGNKLFLLRVNPKTGATKQWSAPVGEGAWAMVQAQDGRIYLGTWESGYLLRFDPKKSDAGIESLGKPSASETYIWRLACAQDGRLYGCTYPNAKLVRFDPATGKSEDLGRMDNSEMYARSVAIGTNGLVYVGIGTKRAQVVAYDPATGRHFGLIPEQDRKPGTAQVFEAADGRVCARIGAEAFVCNSDRLSDLENSHVPAALTPALGTGETIADVTVDRGSIRYQLVDSKAHAETKTNSVSFDGPGVRIFAVGEGPHGEIFGGTALPLEMFGFDPATHKLEDLGNPTSVGGEIYSFAKTGNSLYLCAYPNSFLSVYHPSKPWRYGRAKTDNPRGIGNMGDGHLRPLGLAIGEDKRVYVGSLAPYGQVGGALGIYDPAADAVTENYRNIVTNQGISALCFGARSNLLYGGSSTEAGGGAQPVATHCVFFIFDTTLRRKTVQFPVVYGDSMIGALTAAHGKVVGVSLPSNTLFVIEETSRRVLFKKPIPFGRFHVGALKYYPPHDKIYGLAGNTIFTVDPATGEMAPVAVSPSHISCGLAVTDSGIYFGSETKLIRWRW